MAKIETLQGWRKYLAILGAVTILATMLALTVQAFSLDGALAGLRSGSCPSDPATSVTTSLVAGDIEIKTDYPDGGKDKETIKDNAKTNAKDKALVNGVSQRFTGETFSQTIGISNTSADPNKTYRIYFKFEDTPSEGSSKSAPAEPKKGYVLAGKSSVKLEAGQKYYQSAPDKNPYTFKKVPNTENFYYIEVSGADVGSAFSLPVKVRYDSPASPGGKVQIWAEEFTKNSNTDTEPNAQTTPTCGTHTATWDTQRKELEAYKELRDASKAKSASTYEKESWGAPVNPTVAYNPNTGRYYIKGLRYLVRPKLVSDTTGDKGVDSVEKGVEYRDTLTLPDNIEINPKVRATLSRSGGIYEHSLRDGWNSDGKNNTRFYYTTTEIDRKTTPVFGVDSSDFFGWNTRYYSISSDWRTITFTYKPESWNNPFYMKFGDDFFLVKEPEGWNEAQNGKYAPNDSDTFKFTNKFDVKVKYKHTPPANLTKTIESTVKIDPARPSVTKTHDSPEATFRSGDPIKFIIKVKNEGTTGWVVDEGKPTEGKIVDSLPRAYYVSPAQMLKMLSAKPAAKIEIKDAKLCTGQIAQHSSTNGKSATPSAQLATECTQAKAANLTVSKNDSGKIVIEWEGGESQTVNASETDLTNALSKLLVGENTLYTVTWEIPDKTVYGGQEYNLTVHATVKDQSMSKGDFDETATTNKLNINDKEVPDKVAVEKDYSFNKAAYIGNTRLKQAGHVITSGTIVDYKLTIERKGSKADYKGLPMVDKLSGAQVLLVPVTNENAHLAGRNGIGTITRDKVSYYVLDKPGTYENVIFFAEEKDAAGVVTKKKFVADRIEVIQLPDNKGIQTNSYWYVNSQEFSNPSTVVVTYRTLTAPERTGFSPTEPGTPGALNLGGIFPPDVQIKDKTSIDMSTLSSEKRIITKRGETPQKDETASMTALKPGEKVTYRLRISHIGTEPFKLSGKEIYDTLPKSLANVAWDKSNVEMEVPDQKNLDVEAGDLNSWSITSKNPADGKEDPTQQFIVWDDSLKLSVTKSIYIYVTLTFPPEGEKWRAYREAYGQQSLFNTWHVKDSKSQVSHYLGGESKAVLQKGVVSTGTLSDVSVRYSYNTQYSSGTQSDSGTTLIPDISPIGRTQYVNSAFGEGVGRLKYAQYYGVIHNGGESRMYLNDVQDKLPNGFIFASGIGEEGLKVPKEGCELRLNKSKKCESDVIVFSEFGTSGSITSDEKTKQQITKFYPGNSKEKIIQYKNWITRAEESPVNFTKPNMNLKKASVHALVDPADPTRLTFNFNNSFEGSNLAYDEAREKYYLNAGETIVFEYYAVVDEKANTKPTAHNALAMPFDDFAGTGVKTDAEPGITAKPLEKNISNDGDREIIDTTKANKAGFVGGDDNTQWLTSGVDLVCGSILPGVTKSIVSKTPSGGSKIDNPAYAGYSDTLEWAVTAHNDSNQVIEDYVISDVLDENYVFTGEVTLTQSEYEFSRLWTSGGGTQTVGKFVDGSWEYEQDGKTPKAVTFNATMPYYSRKDIKLEVNGQPHAVLVSRAIAHIWLDTVEDKVMAEDGTTRTVTKLRFNVRVVENTRGLEAPGQGYKVDGYPLSPGDSMTMKISSVNPKKKGDYHVVYNNGYVTLPVNEYNPTDVKRGTPITWDMKYAQTTDRNENDPGEPDSTKVPNYCYNNGTGRICKAGKVPNVQAIQADAVIPILQDAYTSSAKSVEEKEKPDNKVISGDSQDFITLPKQSSVFTYSMEVTNNKDDVIQQMTLIDNLPQPEDKYTFGVGPNRASAFKTDFADEPNLVVETQKNNGNWTLVDPSRYKVEFSDKTTFNSADWDGTSTADWGAKKATSRSVRVSFDSRNGGEPVVTGKTKVRVRFDAQVATGENPKSGAIAYNTFGYSYLAPGSSDIVLRAIPLKVGVQVPNIITLQKSVVDAEGKAVLSTVDTSYQFVIYNGEPIVPQDADKKDEAGTEDNAGKESKKTLGDLLKEQKRDFTVVTVSVKKDKSESEKVEIAPTHKYSYENGKWVETDQPWEWKNKEKYQISEIAMKAGGSFSKFIDNSGENPVETTKQQEFTYDVSKSFHFVAVNKIDKWQIVLKKVDGDTCAESAECTRTLKDAVFGLYSVDKADAMSESALQKLKTDLGADATITPKFESNGRTYYLAKTEKSGADGMVKFADLAGEEYFVKELKAPEGYSATWEGTLFTRPAAGKTIEETVVKNYKPYNLPMAGGMGTLWFTLFGILLAAMAVAGLVMRHRDSGNNW